MKRIVAIDPGKVGFIAVHDEDGWKHLSIADNDDRSIAQFLEDNYREDSVAVIEDVHAVYGSSAGATFEFGAIFGFLKGLIIANGYPYHLIPPKTWQGVIWSNSDKVYLPGKVNAKGNIVKRVNTKETSMNSAKRIFPNLDFKRSPHCKKLDDNKVDATLIAEYARRANL